MKLSLKKRIAFFNTLAVAITTALVFIIIYAVVYISSYRHLDSDISIEKIEILNTLSTNGDSIIINKMPELDEAEHKKMEVNPTFFQIVDARDSLVFKSANLQSDHFLIAPKNEQAHFFNFRLNQKRLRLGQFPIKNNQGTIIGQLIIAVSQQESYNVLSNLLVTLCISFPVLLLVLYSVIYVAASKSIAPVQQLIRAASSINENNIQARLPLGENEDEIYQLANTINDLLDRIENSIQQQKQFTADASHEIRTPLTSIRGTLEVLLRKKREPGHYEEKLKDVITQTDRLQQLLDQLLQLARLDETSIKKEKVSLKKILDEVIVKFDKQIQDKQLTVASSAVETAQVTVDAFFLMMMMDNLFSNAIKYSDQNARIDCVWNRNTQTFSITNSGTEISQEQLPYLFNRFYRTDESRSSLIPGSGLGLAIVKKLADLQQIAISVNSTAGQTTFYLVFPT